MTQEGIMEVRKLALEMRASIQGKEALKGKTVEEYRLWMKNGPPEKIGEELGRLVSAYPFPSDKRTKDQLNFILFL